MESIIPPSNNVPAIAINHTIYSTNPRIIYSPESSCWGVQLKGCGKRYDPWEMRTYTSPDGTLRTFHDTHSRGNDPSSAQMRKLTMRFQGSAVFVYGAPKAHLLHDHGRQELCLHERCEPIDVQARYNEAPSPDQPVLLWSAAHLDPSQIHVLELRLLDNDGGGRLGISFEYLEYTTAPAIIPPQSISHGAKLVNITLHDTNYGIQYSPLTSRHGSKTYNPWNKRYYTPLLRPRDTFHHTSNWGNQATGDGNRQISFEFQGVALYIYGAPKDELETIAGGAYSHGHQEVCVDLQCHAIDNHQTYLNIQGAARYQPVLLWSCEGVSAGVTTHVRIRLIDPESPVGHLRGVSFERAVYIEVQPARSSTRSLGVERVRVVPAEDLVLNRPASWQKGRSSSGTYLWAANTLVEGSLPSWQYEVRAHQIKVFGPPRRALNGKGYAASKLCLNGAECHYVDAEHLYLGVKDQDESENVLLWAFNNLDPSTPHKVSMELVDRFNDNGLRVMAISHLEYSRYMIPWSFGVPVVACILLLCFIANRTGKRIATRLYGTDTPSYRTFSLSDAAPPMSPPPYPGHYHDTPTPSEYPPSSPPSTYLMSPLPSYYAASEAESESSRWPDRP